MKLLRDIFYIAMCVAFWSWFIMMRYPLPCPIGMVAVPTGDRNWCLVGTPWRKTPEGIKTMGPPDD